MGGSSHRAYLVSKWRSKRVTNGINHLGDSLIKVIDQLLSGMIFQVVV